MSLKLPLLLLLSLGHLVTDIYQGALPALLPFLKAKLSLSYTASGVILLAANLTSSVLQPVFGYLSDRRDKTWLLPVGCLAAGAGLSLLSLPESYGPVLLLVIISGLGIAAYHPEGYKAAHFCTGAHQATGMWVFSVGGNLGLALGPILALGLVSRAGFERLPLLALLALVFLAALAFSWKNLQRLGGSHHQGRGAGGPVAPGALASLACAIGAVIMRSWTQLGLVAYIPFYYIDHLRGDPLYAGALVYTFLLGGVVGSLAGAVLADRWGHRRCLTLSLALTTILYPLIGLAPGLWLFPVLGLVGLVLISTFTVTIVMAQRLLPQYLGIASGLMVGFAIGTGGLGVTLLGLVADRFGVPAALQAIALLPPGGLVLSLFIREPQVVEPPE